MTYDLSAQNNTRHYEKRDTYTYELISSVAFLIGVPERTFKNEHEPPLFDCYQLLIKNKNARIIRNLCILRTAIIRNFKKISCALLQEYKTLSSLTNLIPTDCLAQLNQDGVHFPEQTERLTQYITDINRMVSDRINNCKSLFPLWLNWEYLRDIFLMPNGTKEESIKAASIAYYANMSNYPYQVYINWEFYPSSDNIGNILYNDKKFVSLLYRCHKDTFTDLSKVSNVDTSVKNSIYRFLEGSQTVVIVVDCENSDPYDLCATLNNLEDALLHKISKIILYDDIHTSSAWKILDSHTGIRVERVEVTRLKDNKSLVDTRLTAGVCREFYENHVDSFIIVASDSDYWGLFSTISQARFLVMVEHEKFSEKLKEAFEESGIFYCYIDDFYSGAGKDLKLNVMLSEMRQYLDDHIDVNINAMMDEVFRSTRAVMSDTERHQFYEKYIKSLSLSIAPNGALSVQIKEK